MRKLAILASIVLAAPGFMSAATWVETTAGDFADGRFDGNLHASQRGDGAVDFIPRFDYDNDGYADIICPDDSGPFLRLYFGSATGFDSSRSRYFPMLGGGGVAGADLDSDGYPELVHSGWNAEAVKIYWGSDSGPSPDDTTSVATLGRCEAVSIADLDRDGYLDLVTGTTSQYLHVLWGSILGYSVADRSDFRLDGSMGHNFELADFDRDGWTDIAAVPWTRNVNPVLYWGPGRNYRTISWLPVTDSNPHGITTADFDRNGWLDLVYTHYDDTTIAYIYYGDSSGFSLGNREIIHPGICYGGSAAALWDQDSSLDLVFFQGDFPLDTWAVPRVYYNDLVGTPHFDDARSEEVGDFALNASGGMLMDFNRDGAMDVFLDNYSEEEPSVILWGPDWTSRDSVPTGKDHHGTATEAGNFYDRSFREEYESSVFDAGSTMVWYTIAWDDTTPAGTGMTLELRTGDSATPDSTWSAWTGFSNGDSLHDSLSSRFIQYRTAFTYDNPAVLPLLLEVRVEYEPYPRHDVGATAIVAPAGPVDSGSVHVPQVVVHNFGNRAEAFDMTLHIGADYEETASDTLEPGVTDTLLLPPWTAMVVGSFNTLAYTRLETDEKPDNDTVADSVRVLEPPRPDVGPVQIIAPAGSMDSGTVVTPLVAVRNFGLLDASFPVTLEIGSGYAETVLDTLAVGQTDTVEFPAWMAPSVTTMPTRCYTDLIGDGDRSNDTIADSVRVTRPPPPDVGAIEILSPGGTPDSGTTFVPRAIIHNFGPYVSSFPVSLSIGSTYLEVAFDTLTVGQTDTVDFPTWFAGPVGTHAITCFTQLERDGDRSNDTARASVDVQTYPVHDIGAVSILDPPSSMSAGDTVVPRATVRNFGNRTERYFDVRFRVGSAYSRSVVIDSALDPGSTIEVAFPTWIAAPGSFEVSCSTSMASDVDSSNDEVTLDLSVVQPYSLVIEPDTSGRIEPGHTQDYRFHAEVESDTGMVVELPPVLSPDGWSATLYDSSLSAPLADTLGLLMPGQRRAFALRVVAPPPDLSGTTDSLHTHTFVVHGFVRGAPLLADTAFLALTLVPYLEVHNFPNPFSDRTSFVIGLPEDGAVTLTIYTRAGESVRRLLVDSDMRAGINIVNWDARNDGGNPVGSGTYQYVFIFTTENGSSRITKKLVVTRE